MRPLWWVAALAIAADGSFLALELVAYLNTREDRLALLAGVTVAVLVAHLLAFAVARREGRPDRGAWAIAMAQLAGALTATLLVADLWILELFLLGIVPLQVAVVDRPRRIPLAIILASWAWRAWWPWTWSIRRDV